MTLSATPEPEARRWLISIAVMLTTVMVILDKTIVNVALPHMMGALGARSDQITWVLTTYIVAEVIVMPLTGFLSGYFGRKQVMQVSIGGFVITSALCGMANSLDQMIVFRILQGAFGASLIPLSQSVMVDIFPGRERGKAMALWGMGIMLGPVLGPTLGGFITQHLSWHWVFYINLPVGILNLVLVSRLIRQTVSRPRRPDLVGALFMAFGVGALQMVLDRGNEDDWFQSHTIMLLSILGFVGLAVFVIRSLQRNDAILNLKLLADRNLAVASFMMAVFGLGLFGTIMLQPIMLERLLGYPAQTTGLVMAPRGLGSAISMLLVARLITHIDPRKLVALGLILTATGTWLMSWYNLYIDPAWAMWPGVVQGLGMGMIFVPLSTIAFETIAAKDTDAASGIYNLARTIGTSIGISVAATELSRAGQISWNQLGGYLNPYNPMLQAWLRNKSLTMQDPLAAQLLGSELGRQSTMVAFVDVYWLIALSFIVLLPMVLLIQRPQHQRSASEVAEH